MKYIVYHATSPLGYPIDIWTNGEDDKVTYEKLFEDEASRIMAIEKTGAKVPMNVPQTISKPLEATTTPQNSFCEVHKMEMKERDGKWGKFYSHAKELDGEWIYCTGKGWGVK